MLKRVHGAKVYIGVTHISWAFSLYASCFFGNVTDRRHWTQDWHHGPVALVGDCGNEQLVSANMLAKSQFRVVTLPS